MSAKARCTGRRNDHFLGTLLEHPVLLVGGRSGGPPAAQVQERESSRSSLRIGRSLSVHSRHGPARGPRHRLPRGTNSRSGDPRVVLEMGEGALRRGQHPCMGGRGSGAVVEVDGSHRTHILPRDHMVHGFSSAVEARMVAKNSEGLHHSAADPERLRLQRGHTHAWGNDVWTKCAGTYRRRRQQYNSGAGPLRRQSHAQTQRGCTVEEHARRRDPQHRRMAVTRDRINLQNSRVQNRVVQSGTHIPSSFLSYVHFECGAHATAHTGSMTRTARRARRATKKRRATTSRACRPFP